MSPLWRKPQVVICSWLEWTVQRSPVRRSWSNIWATVCTTSATSSKTRANTSWWSSGGMSTFPAALTTLLCDDAARHSQTYTTEILLRVLPIVVYSPSHATNEHFWFFANCLFNQLGNKSRTSVFTLKQISSVIAQIPYQTYKSSLKSPKDIEINIEYPSSNTFS